MLQNVKLLHKRTVAQLTLSILLAPIPSAIPVTEAQTVNCSVPTLHTFSNHVWHNWIANGQPLSSYCWSVTPMRVAVVGNADGQKKRLSSTTAVVSRKRSLFLWMLISRASRSGTHWILLTPMTTRHGMYSK